MSQYRIEVSKDELFEDTSTWCVKIYAGDSFIVTYGNIDTESDAQIIGESFIDGITYSRGES